VEFSRRRLDPIKTRSFAGGPRRDSGGNVSRNHALKSDDELFTKELPYCNSRAKR
jgi:hypothetical protein